MPRVLLLDNVDTSCKDRLETEGFEVTSRKDKILLEELLRIGDTYDAIVVRSGTKITQEVIDACPNVQVYGRAGNNVAGIDVKHAAKKGAAVVSTPLGSVVSVAELAWAHILSVARHIHDNTYILKTTGRIGNKVKGMELYGKVYGQAGAGRIGYEMALRALAFGMDVVVYDPSPESQRRVLETRMVVNGQERRMRVASSLEELARTADVFAVQVEYKKPEPGKPGTHHLINEGIFSLLKDNSIFVNCAHGNVMDEQALLRHAHRLYGAGLDVFADEGTRLDLEAQDKGNITFAEDHPFRNPGVNFSLTSHVGAQTPAASRKIGIEMAELLIAYLTRNTLAERLGYFAAKFVNGDDIADVKIKPYGMDEKNIESLVSPIAGGLIKATGKQVSYNQALDSLKESGVAFELKAIDDPYRNYSTSLTLEVTTKSGASHTFVATQVTETSDDGTAHTHYRLVGLDGYKTGVDLEGQLLFVEHFDREDADWSIKNIIHELPLEVRNMLHYDLGPNPAKPKNNLFSVVFGKKDHERKVVVYPTSLPDWLVPRIATEVPHVAEGNGFVKLVDMTAYAKK